MLSFHKFILILSSFMDGLENLEFVSGVGKANRSASTYALYVPHAQAQSSQHQGKYCFEFCNNNNSCSHGKTWQRNSPFDLSPRWPLTTHLPLDCIKSYLLFSPSLIVTHCWLCWLIKPSFGNQSTWRKHTNPGRTCNSTQTALMLQLYLHHWAS